MPNNANAVRVAGSGALYISRIDATSAVAPSGTAALGADFVELGYVSEDGVTLSKSVDFEDINAWQSVTPVRKVLSGSELTVSASLMESSDEVMSLWSGGSITTTGSNTRISIPSEPQLVDRILVVDYTDKGNDGTITHRFVVPRVNITEVEEITLARTEAVTFGITFSALAPNEGNDIAYFLKPSAA